VTPAELLKDPENAPSGKTTHFSGRRHQPAARSVLLVFMLLGLTLPTFSRPTLSHAGFPSRNSIQTHIN
jgi:hypothetical protein